MAAEEFLTVLAELGVHVGTKLVKKAMEPQSEVDRVGLANLIISCSIDQASEIVCNLGAVGNLDNDGVEFGRLAGTIVGGMFGLVQVLTHEKISVEDSTLNLDDLCGRATAQLRRQVRQ